ncbi:hypothetical protein RHSIM_Rhsim02G0164800 [Rhododendron simsii]|uniref:GAG-pre-integrase domain-containing protein n=1 Tax=Rhododendron simsii TaxID=118357 RepID=A0A834HF12_RHOSS|nr:hypothetical protein RHSIM_Rhsim02G0164800 [Rhododendron simsii]
MKTPTTSILSFVFLLLISFSLAASADTHEEFLQCLSLHSPNSTSISKLIYTPNNSSYLSVLNFSIQNLRFTSPSTPKPLVIVTPFDESQIQATVYCSKNHGMQIRVRSGGHDYEGLFGGGYGLMLRKYGLAADNVIDARIIDVNGQVLDRKSMGEDLFWAIRGGGGASFGVILAWKVNLVNVPSTVTVFIIAKTLDQNATNLIYKWQHIAPKFPKDLFIRILIRRVNSSENGKWTIQASFNSLYLRGIGNLIPLMQERFPELGLTEEDCTEMSWIESILYFAGFPTGESLNFFLDRTPLTRQYFKAKSDYVKEPIPVFGLEGIWRMFYEDEGELAEMILSPYGGKMDEIAESAIPFPHRKGNLYKIQHLVYWNEEGEVLKIAFGGTTATRLRALTLKFNSYKMNPQHSMPEHLRVMSAMIRDLRAAGNILTMNSKFSLRLAERQDAKRGNEVLVVEPDQRNKPFGHGSISSGFYVLDLDGLNKKAFMASHDDDVISSSVKWHARLGHIGQDKMTWLARESFLGPLAKVNLPICESRMAGKAISKTIR